MAILSWCHKYWDGYKPTPYRCSPAQRALKHYQTFQMNDNATSDQADYWVTTRTELQRGDKNEGRKEGMTYVLGRRKRGQ